MLTPPAPERTDRRTVVGRAGVAALIAVLTVGAFGPGGCTRRADTLDRPATEAAILAQVKDRIPVPVTSVTCPRTVPRGEGRSITCRAVLGGGLEVPLRVTARSDDRLAVDPLAAVIVPDTLAASVRRELQATLARPVTASCGTAVRVVAPGTVLRCPVADGKTKKTASVTIVDVDGSLRIDVR